MRRKGNLSFKRAIYYFIFCINIWDYLCITQHHRYTQWFQDFLVQSYVEFLWNRVYKSNGTFSSPGLCFHVSTRSIEYLNAYLYFRKKNTHTTFCKNWINDHSKQKHAVQKLNLPLENRKFNELLMECNAPSSKLFVSWRCNQHAD